MISSFRMFKIVVVALLFLATFVSGQVYEDKRCRCICPSPAPELIIADVPPSQCNCVGAVLPRLVDELKDRESEFCLSCDCKYETRNTTIIKVVVITIIWILALLMVYSAFLLCLEPFMFTERGRAQNGDHDVDEGRRLIDADDDEV